MHRDSRDDANADRFGVVFDLKFRRRRIIPTAFTNDPHAPKRPRAAKAIAERGAWLLFLPKYSPDLNPIEMAFAKLKTTLLRKAAARTLGNLWRAVGDICNLFTPDEGWDYLKAVGYVAH